MARLARIVIPAPLIVDEKIKKVSPSFELTS